MEYRLPGAPRAGQQMGFWDVSAQRWAVHPYVVWPAQQPTLTTTNVDGAIAALTISAAYSQAEVTALRDATEALADDVRALKSLLLSCGIAK